MAAKGFLLLPLFLISVTRYYRSKIQTKIYFPFCLVFCTFNRIFAVKTRHYETGKVQEHGKYIGISALLPTSGSQDFR